MSDTTVQQIDNNALVDMFPEAWKGSTGSPFKAEETDTPLFPLEQAQSTPNVPATADTPVGEEEKPAETQLETADILETDKTPTVTPSSKEIADLAAYYEERIKNGTFVKLEIEDDKGNKTPFIPKTAEEYDEVFQLQIDWKLDQAKKELEKNWFESKSPAWKAVSKYAELTDDPTQVIPFLQGVKMLQTVANLDENDPDGAEQIVRMSLEQTNSSEKAINAQIEALKTTDKLKETAAEVKPSMVQQQQRHLAYQMKQREEEEKAYSQLVQDIKVNTIKALEQPIFGKNNLKQEEKAAIYDLIGEPHEETGGFGIYSHIDQLFEKKDFEMLKQVTLLMTNKDAFFRYLGINIANQTAASLEKKLRVAGDMRTASGNDFVEEQQPTVSRNQFSKNPVFGRR